MKNHFSLSIAIVSLLLAACAAEDTYKPSTPAKRPVVQSIKQAPGSAAQQAGAPRMEEPRRIIALLLPLSGEGTQVGRAMQDAATLALDDIQSSSGSVILLPKDSANSQNAAKSAIQEGANIAIGPVFSRNVETAAPLFKAKGIPVLSLSNNRQLAGNGTYVLGFLPGQQVDRIVSYASRKGYSKIAALLPNDAYGKLSAEALGKAAASNSVSIVSTQYYPAGASDISLELSKISGSGADALYFPEGGKMLTSLASALNSAQLAGKIKILGSGQWDDASLPSHPELEGSWFVASDMDKRMNFEGRFKSVFGYAPPRLASLAYDAVAMAAAAPVSAGSGKRRIEFPFGQFNAPVDGPINCDASGLCSRSLSVVEITSRGPQEIDEQSDFSDSVN